MAIDPTEIELSDDQKRRLAALAERAGKDYSELVDEWLSRVDLPRINGREDEGSRPRNLYEAFQSVGAIGCVKDAPPDLATNPKYMEGFGRN
jgi:hypothetical protein